MNKVVSGKRSDWVEMYRPQRIEDCILTNTIQRKVDVMVKNNRYQNLLLAGNSGCGKTCLIESFIRTIDAESQWWDSQKIESIRKGLDSSYMHTMSVYGCKKMVILDEFDLASKNVQKLILKPMEGTGRGAGISAWFLIANDISGVSEAILSRTTTLDFTIEENETEEMKRKCFDRCRYILTEENITFKDDDLNGYINAFFPGIRKIINELQAGVDVNNNLMPI